MKNQKQYLGVTKIAKHFDIEADELNNIFVLMEWVVKDGVHYMLQECGEENGGEQNSVKYLMLSNAMLYMKRV